MLKIRQISFLASNLKKLTINTSILVQVKRTINLSKDFLCFKAIYFMHKCFKFSWPRFQFPSLLSTLPLKLKRTPWLLEQHLQIVRSPLQWQVKKNMCILCLTHLCKRVCWVVLLLTHTILFLGFRGPRCKRKVLVTLKFHLFNRGLPRDTSLLGTTLCGKSFEPL